MQLVLRYFGYRGFRELNKFEPLLQMPPSVLRGYLYGRKMELEIYTLAILEALQCVHFQTSHWDLSLVPVNMGL